jgi:tetratricopeptide (TPR) repeat protein
LESLSARTSRQELTDEILFDLGSVYQFYDEKELAIKTFERAASKKKKKSENDESSSRFLIKTALILLSLEKYTEAAEQLKKCGGGQKDICALIRSVVSFIEKKENDGSAEKILESIEGTGTDFIFEAALLLFLNLIKRRKYELSAKLNEILSRMLSNVTDYNLVLEYGKISRSLHRISSKSKKTPTEIRKVVPSVKRRVRTRRNV